MNPEELFLSFLQEFATAGCVMHFDPVTAVVTASLPETVKQYTLPAYSAANQYHIPGWYLAGIWDDMHVPGLNRKLTAADLTAPRWSFTRMSNLGLWLKQLPADKSKYLFYYFDSFYLVDAAENLGNPNRLPTPKELVAVCPSTSIYHIEKLFEERGWFAYPETSMPSQAIEGYRI